jgi:hypothetical protein
MAQDADGNYYYEEGTIAEEMDNLDVYEDSDGNMGIFDGTNEARISMEAFFNGTFRDASMTTDDLASGEGAVYWLDNGDTTYSLEAAFHNPDDDAVQTSTLATVGA